MNNGLVYMTESCHYTVNAAVACLTWAATDVDTDLQLSSPVLANDHPEAPGSNPENQLAKRRKGTVFMEVQ